MRRTRSCDSLNLDDGLSPAFPLTPSLEDFKSTRLELLEEFVASRLHSMIGKQLHHALYIDSLNPDDDLSPAISLTPSLKDSELARLESFEAIDANPCHSMLCWDDVGFEDLMGMGSPLL